MQTMNTELYKIGEEIKTIDQSRGLTEQDLLKFKKEINKHINFFPVNKNGEFLEVETDPPVPEGKVAIPKPHFFERKGPFDKF